MRCRKAERMLSDHLDGALGTDAEAALAAHLERCPSCASSRARLERTRLLIAGGGAPDPGDAYWAGFWPRLGERLAAGADRRPPMAERLAFLLFPGRLAGLLSPVPALVILALVCFNVLLLTQARRGVPPARVAARGLPSLAARDASPAAAPAARRRSGVDAVLCDRGARAGIDEYVLRPVAFQGPARAARGTRYVLMRAPGAAASRGGAGSY